MKVLNLYSGIGGNRKHWKDVEVTAVEYNPQIADIYKDYFPFDNIIVGDAHEYLIKHIDEYDFVWSSPPCPSHSKLNSFLVPNGTRQLEYPDMRLYAEILLLQHWHKGQWVVENVEPYYEPLIPGRRIDRHVFWSNFKITGFQPEVKIPIKASSTNDLEKAYGYDLSKYKVYGKMAKRQAIRNCVHPETGNHILNCARGIYEQNNREQTSLFAS